MVMGRPKAENPKKNVIAIRLTDSELVEIETLLKKLKISKKDAFMRGIREIAKPQQVYYRSQMPNFKPKKIPKHSEGIIEED